jgi:transposase InsO family protein
VERFFRSLKEECVWQHNFGDFAEARTAITNWIHWYNAERRTRRSVIAARVSSVGYNPNSWFDSGGE